MSEQREEDTMGELGTPQYVGPVALPGSASADDWQTPVLKLWAKALELSGVSATGDAAARMLVVALETWLTARGAAAFRVTTTADEDQALAARIAAVLVAHGLPPAAPRPWPAAVETAVAGLVIATIAQRPVLVPVRRNDDEPQPSSAPSAHKGAV